MSGKIFLIPNVIADGGIDQIPSSVYKATSELKLYFAENAKMLRRYLKLLHPDLILDNEIEIYEIGKKADGAWKEDGIEEIWKGKDAGVVSDAGCPGIGDPGSEIIVLAHQSGIQVVPLSGPCSFMLALMSSGMNGQSFAFNGYLPIQDAPKKKVIRQLADLALNTGQTQIFMETPYRNQKLLDELLKLSPKKLDLCVAIDLNGANEFILTQSIADWQKMQFNIGKVPAVFLFGKTHVSSEKTVF